MLEEPLGQGGQQARATAGHSSQFCCLPCCLAFSSERDLQRHLSTAKHLLTCRRQENGEPAQAATVSVSDFKPVKYVYDLSSSEAFRKDLTTRMQAFAEEKGQNTAIGQKEEERRGEVLGEVASLAPCLKAATPEESRQGPEQSKEALIGQADDGQKGKMGGESRQSMARRVLQLLKNAGGRKRLEQPLSQTQTQGTPKNNQKKMGTSEEEVKEKVTIAASRTLYPKSLADILNRRKAEEEKEAQERQRIAKDRKAKEDAAARRLQNFGRRAVLRRRFWDSVEERRRFAKRQARQKEEEERKKQRREEAAKAAERQNIRTQGEKAAAKVTKSVPKWTQGEFLRILETYETYGMPTDLSIWEQFYRLFPYRQRCRIRRKVTELIAGWENKKALGFSLEEIREVMNSQTNAALEEDEDGEEEDEISSSSSDSDILALS